MTKPADRALITRIDSAMGGIERLTAYGEDAVWRPANKAWEAMRDARAEIDRLRMIVRKVEQALNADDVQGVDGDMYASGNGCAGVVSSDDTRSPDVGSVADISAQALGFENEQDRIDHWNKMIGPIPSWERGG